MGVIVKEHTTSVREEYVPMHPILNEKKTKGFIIVPKVGSSTMSQILEHYNNWEKTPNITSSCILYSLIRHPVDRWISGTTEHWNPILTQDNNNLQPLIDTSFKTLLDDSFEDRHTQPQAWNFDKYSQTIQFKFENIDELINELVEGIYPIHERNHLTMAGLQGSIHEIVAEKAQRDLILDKYAEDYLLWKNAI